MKKWMWTVLIILGLAGIAGPDVGHAETPPPNAATSTTGETGPLPDSRAGGYAAVGCGLFGRALVSGFVNVGTIAGAIATCVYMLFDGLYER